MQMASSTKFSIPTAAQKQEGHHCTMTRKSNFKVLPGTFPGAQITGFSAGYAGCNWLYIAIFIIVTQVFPRKHRECASRHTPMCVIPQVYAEINGLFAKKNSTFCINTIKISY